MITRRKFLASMISGIVGAGLPRAPFTEPALDYLLYCFPDEREMIDELTGFVPFSSYANKLSLIPFEIGSFEDFRWLEPFE